MRHAALVLILMPSALAAQPAPPAEPLKAELAPLSFLAGSCWRATFPNGNATDTHCFTSIMGGQFLRDRHVVAGAPDPYWGETLYRWDAGARRIHFDYYSSDGAHSAGSATPTANGLAFTEDHDGASTAPPMTIRTSWTRDGDGYVALSEAQQGATWRELWRMRFTRISPAPAELAP